MTEEQLELIEDLHGEEGEKLRNAAKAYKATIAKRLKIQEKEAVQKAELIELVNRAGLKPVSTEDGKKIIRCRIDDTLIEATHEEKDNVKVKVDE